MTGHDFIALAGRLAASNDEAALRSAVSRAYYGAFHIVVDFLADLECSVSNNDHAEPTRRLNASGNPSAIEAGQLLSELQGARIKADYRLNDQRPATSSFARDNFEVAHSIRSELEKCVGVEVRAAMKAQIEQYAAKRAGRG